jgi:hypothetical protein
MIQFSKANYNRHLDFGRQKQTRNFQLGKLRTCSNRFFIKSNLIRIYDFCLLVKSTVADNALRPFESSSFTRIYGYIASYLGHGSALSISGP